MMKKSGTPTLAGPGIATERVGLVAAGLPFEFVSFGTCTAVRFGFGVSAFTHPRVEVEVEALRVSFSMQTRAGRAGFFGAGLFGAGVEVAVAVPVGAGVAVEVSTGVCVGVCVCVGVWSGACVAVSVGAAVAVSVGACIGACVAVMVGTGVDSAATGDDSAEGVGVGSSAGAGVPTMAANRAATERAVAAMRRVNSLRMSALWASRLSRRRRVEAHTSTSNPLLELELTT